MNLSNPGAGGGGAMAFGSPAMGMFEDGEAGGGLLKSELSSPRFWGSRSRSSISSSEGSTPPPGLLSDSSFAETESSEDDDFVAGLAEQMAHSMLDDSDDNIGTSEVDSLDRTPGLWGEPCWNRVQFLGGSNNSSFSEAEQQAKAGGWCTGYWSPGYSSSGSKVSSPPSTPGCSEDWWDAGASSNDTPGDDSNHIIFNTTTNNNNTSSRSDSYLPELHWKNNAFTESRVGGGALPVLTKPYAAVAAAAPPGKSWSSSLNDDDRNSPCRASSKQAPVGVWNRQSRPQAPAPAQHQCLPPARSSYRLGSGAATATGAQRLAWQAGPPAPNGSVMRAVFLGGSADRSSTGTGVFLPRSSSDYTKRKTSCSSVLLPSRIVQVLNLNVDDMRCQPSVQSSAAAPTPAPGNGYGGGGGNEWKTYTYQCSEVQQCDESTLPTEWSY